MESMQYIPRNACVYIIKVSLKSVQYIPRNARVQTARRGPLQCHL